MKNQTDEKSGQSASRLSDEKIQKPSYNFSLIGTVILVLVVVATAAILPFSIVLPLETVFLKVSWRNCNLIPFLVLLAIYDFKTATNKAQIIQNMKSKEVIILCLAIAVSFTVMQLGYFVSGQYTTMAHASIFSNLPAVFLVVYRAVSK